MLTMFVAMDFMSDVIELGDDMSRVSCAKTEEVPNTASRAGGRWRSRISVVERADGSASSRFYQVYHRDRKNKYQVNIGIQDIDSRAGRVVNRLLHSSLSFLLKSITNV